MARLRGNTWTATSGSGSARHRRGGFATKALAERFEAECKVAAERGLAPPEPDRGTGAAHVVTLEETLRRASRSLWAGAKGRAVNEATVLDFAATLAGGRRCPVTTINDAHLIDWCVALELRGNSAATVNRKLSALSGVLDYAYKAQLIGRKPVIPWRRVEGGRIVVLSDEQVAFFTLALRGPDVDFMHFLLHTGMRRGEATKFRVGDVRYNDSFAPGPVSILLPGAITKSGKARTVPLTRDAKHYMRPYLERAASPGHDGRVWGCIDPDLFTERFRKARLASPWAAEDDLTPHALRHACATRLIRNGLRPTLVQAWLGHATIEQTMAYVHETEADLTTAASAL